MGGTKLRSVLPFLDPTFHTVICSEPVKISCPAIKTYSYDSGSKNEANLIINQKCKM